jgi:anion-transporting  ArsA/GET3 family ATPase
MALKVVLCCGTGGVGKTTAAAALGVAWTLAGKRVVVLTIDPAKRLADALGLDGLDNTPRRVALDGLDLPEGASLHALMLDRKATFDESVTRLSEDPESARRLLQNRYYHAVSTRLTGSHEYMATEKLFELATSGEFDVIVVDTPPSQHAIEFFHAPERIQKLFEGPVVRRLVNPGRGLTGGGTRRVLKWILSLVGRQVVDDIGEFFRLMSSAAVGFAEHGKAVGMLLRSSQSTILLITSPARAARDGAVRFLEQSRQDGLHVDGFVLNRFISPSGTTEDTWRRPAPADIDAVGWEAWLDALREQAARRDAIAARHLEAARDLSGAAAGAPVWALPFIADGLRSADGLADLAAHLPPGAEPTLRATTT